MLDRVLFNTDSQELHKQPDFMPPMCLLQVSTEMVRFGKENAQQLLRGKRQQGAFSPQVAALAQHMQPCPATIAVLATRMQPSCIPSLQALCAVRCATSCCMPVKMEDFPVLPDMSSLRCPCGANVCRRTVVARIIMYAHSRKLSNLVCASCQGRADAKRSRDSWANDEVLQPAKDIYGDWDMDDVAV